MNKKLYYPIFVLLATAVLVALMIASRPQLAAEEFEAVLSNVRTMTVSAKTEHLLVRSQGTVQPRSESQLISEVSGRIVELSPAMVSGGAFRNGDLLLKIDPADYEAAVGRRRAALKRAAVEREFAADEQKRMKKLQAQKLASQAQLDDTRRRAEVAEANYAEAKIDLETSIRDLQRTAIYAPYDGRVREEHVDVGQFVSRGGDIGTLYATDYVEIRLPIASSQLAYLDISIDQQGQLLPESAAPVEISGEYGGRTFHWQGSVVRTEAEIDARSSMLYGIAVVKNNFTDEVPPLLVGLFVNATIRGREVQNVVRLPRSSMRDNSQVLVVDESNRLRFRTVELLRIERDEIVIRSGLSSGERVSLSPMQAVVEGMKVNPIAIDTGH